MIDVLIVEDDPMVAQINKRFVDSVEEFRVTDMASNGKEALSILKNKKIHLVILDIYMPKFNGLQFLKEMRKYHKNIDVIIVTAAKDSDIIDTALKLGAVDYLVKPFEYGRLKASLGNYKIRFRLLSNDKPIGQEEIDTITGGLSIGKKEVPKGMQNKTLERIRKFLKDNPEKSFSSEDIASKMTVSRVTVKRYLDYLESIGEITLEVQYGSIGRPTHLYQYIGI